MNPSAIVSNRHTRARQSTLRQIARIGPFLEGSLSPFKRPGCTQPGWHLTFKQHGRTRTLYVPMELVAEVKQWTLNYRRLKALIRQVTRHSIGLEPVFCANATASKNYYTMMQVAQILWIITCRGGLRRLYDWARRATELALAQAIWEGLRTCRLPPDLPPLGQIRFSSD